MPNSLFRCTGSTLMDLVWPSSWSPSPNGKLVVSLPTGRIWDGQRRTHPPILPPTQADDGGERLKEGPLLAEGLCRPSPASRAGKNLSMLASVPPAWCPTRLRESLKTAVPFVNEAGWLPLSMACRTGTVLAVRPHRRLDPTSVEPFQTLPEKSPATTKASIG